MYNFLNSSPIILISSNEAVFLDFLGDSFFESADFGEAETDLGDNLGDDFGDDIFEAAGDAPNDNGDKVLNFSFLLDSILCLS